MGRGNLPGTQSVERLWNLRELGGGLHLPAGLLLGGLKLFQGHPASQTLAPTAGVRSQRGRLHRRQPGLSPLDQPQPRP